MRGLGTCILGRRCSVRGVIRGDSRAGLHPSPRQSFHGGQDAASRLHQPRCQSRQLGAEIKPVLLFAAVTAAPTISPAHYSAAIAGGKPYLIGGNTI